MTRRLAGVLLTLTILAFASNAQLLAHPGDAHKIMGTVTMAATDHVTIKDKDGKEVTIRVTKDTKVKAKPPMEVEEIQAGTRVVVTAVMEKDNTMTARTIEVAAASTTK